MSRETSKLNYTDKGIEGAQTKDLIKAYEGYSLGRETKKLIIGELQKRALNLLEEDEDYIRYKNKLRSND